MLYLSATDPDIIRLAERVGDLIDRTSSVETKINVGLAFFLFLLGLAGALIRWVGWPQFNKWKEDVQRAVKDSIEGEDAAASRRNSESG